MKSTFKILNLTGVMLVCMFASSAASAGKGFSFDSAIVDAVENDQKKVVEMLLNEGISPDEMGKFETTPLHRAAFNGSDDIVEVLISKGANANKKDFGGATPLHMAARKGNINVVRKLIKYGADIDAQDNEGFTPLQRAIANDNTAVGVFLLEAGANGDTVDSSGNTPLIESVRKGNATIIEELLVQGADKYKKNSAGYSANDYAERNADDKVLEVLSKSSSDIKRQRVLEGNNVIVVSKTEIDRNEVPLFLQDDLSRVSLKKYEPLTTNQEHKIDLSSARVLGKNELPWLNSRESEMVKESVSVRPLSSYDDFGVESVYDELEVYPNMPVVTTAKVSVEDSISEGDISDILALENSSSGFFEGNKVEAYKEQPTRNKKFKYDTNNFLETQPVNKLQVIRKADSKIEEDNIIDLGSARKESFASNRGSFDRGFDYKVDGNDFMSGQSTYSASIPRGEYKLAKNEIDYSGYNPESLPASLKMKYYLSLPPEDRKSFYMAEKSTGPYGRTTDNVKVRQINLASNDNNFLDFEESSTKTSYRRMPVARVSQVDEIGIGADDLGNGDAPSKLWNNRTRNEKIVYDRYNEKLIDREFGDILSSSNEKFDATANLPVRVAENSNYKRGDLIDNINSFYNNSTKEGEQYKTYDLSSLQNQRSRNIGVEATSYNSLTDNDVVANANLPKSQIYKKLLADKVNQKLPDNISYSDANINYSNLKTQKSGFSSASPETDKYLSSKFSSGPASMDNTRVKTDSLLSWEGFTDDDLDKLYSEAVLGVPATTVVESTPPKPIMVESFPEDGVIKPVYKSDIIVSPKVNSVPVQVSDMETIKPPKEEDIMPKVEAVKDEAITVPDLSKFETKVGVDEKPSIDLPDVGGVEALPNIDEALAEIANDGVENPENRVSIETSYNDNDGSLSGNHSIIGAFASTDDAVSYFNSISSRLGFAYNHKILKSKEDGKYYIAIGRLGDSSVAEKLCKAYSSDYVACVESNPTNVNTGFDILKVKKVYSILGEFGSADEAKLYFSKRIASKNVNYKVAKAGSSDIYLLQLGPLSDGVEAKKLCKDVAGIDQKCKITVK